MNDCYCLGVGSALGFWAINVAVWVTGLHTKEASKGLLPASCIAVDPDLLRKLPNMLHGPKLVLGGQHPENAPVVLRLHVLRKFLDKMAGKRGLSGLDLCWLRAGGTVQYGDGVTTGEPKVSLAWPV